MRCMEGGRDEGRNDRNHEPLVQQELTPGRIFVRDIDQDAKHRLETAIGLTEIRLMKYKEIYVQSYYPSE